MSRKEALEYVMTSPADTTAFKRAVVVLADNSQAILIAKLALGVSILSVALNALLRK
ncbi:MAG: hypothetical protein WBR11_07645 [Terriglobales bacterium]